MILILISLLFRRLTIILCTHTLLAEANCFVVFFSNVFSHLSIALKEKQTEAL